MSDNSYYDSPLNWENIQLGIVNKAYAEKGNGDVVHIKKKIENSQGDEFVVVDVYDNYDVELSKNRKHSYDGWLMIGYADWEHKEINPSEFSKYVIKAYCRKHMDHAPYGEDLV